LQENLQLADRVVAFADELAISPAELALAWVMAKGMDIVPIPGTKRRAYLEENADAATIKLPDEVIATLDDAVAPEAVRGGRYADRDMALLNQ